METVHSDELLSVSKYKTRNRTMSRSTQSKLFALFKGIQKVPSSKHKSWKICTNKVGQIEALFFRRNGSCTSLPAQRHTKFLVICVWFLNPLAKAYTTL